MHLFEVVFSERTHQREGVFPHCSADQDNFEVCSSQLCRDVDRICDDGELLEALQTLRHCRGSCAGVQDDALALFYHFDGGRSDPLLFSKIVLLLFLESGIDQGAGRHAQRAAM